MTNISQVSHILPIYFDEPLNVSEDKYEKLGKYWPYCTS